MPKLLPYGKSLAYSYVLGAYPSLCLARWRPDAMRRLLISPNGYGGEGVEKLRAICRSLGVREETAESALRRESGKDNCRAGVVFDKYKEELSDVLPHAVLWRVSEFGNLGASARACLGFGIKDIAIVKPCADMFDPQTVRSSMGALFGVRAAEFDDFDAYLSRYPGHRVYLFMLDGKLGLEEAASSKPAAYSLVFGNESSGLPSEFAQLGSTVRIRISGDIDSLNLASAVAIGAYAFASR